MEDDNYNAQSKKTCWHSFSDGFPEDPPWPENVDWVDKEMGEEFGSEPNTKDFKFPLVLSGIVDDAGREPAAKDSLKPRLKVAPQPETQNFR